MANDKTYDFLSLVTHALREPLAITKWSVELFTKEELEAMPPSVREKIDNIYSSTKVMIDLVSDMLDVLRIQENKVINEPANVVPSDVVNELIVKFKPQADKRKLTMNFTDEAKGVTIVIDPKHFRDALKNLISNAIFYNKESGQINILLRTEQNQLYFEVSDTGIGIPEIEKGRVFEEFYRTSNAIRSGVLGTGLGLYKIKSYIAAWKGEIGFESQENVSSKFWFKIPLSQ